MPRTPKFLKEIDRAIARAKQNDQREKSTGQYSHGLERVCVCGHPKGAHVAGGHECIAHEFDGGDPDGCNKFRLKR